MYVNGMGFGGIERVKGVHHTTMITWLKQVGKLLPDAYDPETIPQVGELGYLNVLFEAHLGHRKPLLALKKQNLAVDSCESLLSRDLRMGVGRP